METKLYLQAREDAAAHAVTRELQSFRGIAAIIVLVYHAALYFDLGATPQFWMTFVLNAHAAVVSFFVLSGFLLALSLIRAPRVPARIAAFYLRRAFRIYPALWLGCLAALAYVWIVGGAAAGSPASDWAMANFDSAGLSVPRAALAFAGLKSSLPLPIWSLAIELIASLLMPLVVLTMRRSTMAFALLSALLVLMSIAGIDRPLLVPTYLADFAIGASIALLVPTWRRLARLPGVAILGAVGGFAMLWFVRNATGADFGMRYHQGLAATLEAVGAALLIGTIHVRADRFRWLAPAPMVRLGDISYSLYLLHLPMIGVLSAVGLAIAPSWIATHPGMAASGLVLATLAVTIPLADWCFRRVELPWIGVGQRIVRATERRRGDRWSADDIAAMQKRG